jgi:CHAT domain-containing protein
MRAQLFKWAKLLVFCVFTFLYANGEGRGAAQIFEAQQPYTPQPDPRVVELYKKVNELQSVGKYAEAIPYARRALEIEERRSGANYPDVGILLYNLAHLYSSSGRYSEAEPLLVRSLAILEKTLSPDHPDVVRTLNSLGSVYGSQGRYADAQPVFKRLLSIREKTLGPDHPDVAKVMDYLAWTYKKQGLYADAETLHLRSLIIEEKTLGPDHPDVATTLIFLAELYSSQGRYADAEPLFRRSLSIQERVFGPDHPQVAGSLDSLANLYWRLGRYADAEPLYKRALAIVEKTRGPDHQNFAASLQNLAMLYASQGRYAEADPLYKRAVAIEEGIFGSDHPNIAAMLNNVAGLYLSLDRYADAEPLLKRSLAISEKAVGPDHPLAAASLNNLAELYSKQSRFGDALPLITISVRKGFVKKEVFLGILTGAVDNSFISKTDAANESYEIVQRAASSAAANAINQLSMRFAAGTGQLAQLVRREQDLSTEKASLDKILIGTVAKEPRHRDPVKEQLIRNRLKSVATEHTEIETSLNQSFPDFAALSKPRPVSVKDTQSLLADDEALLVIDFDAKSYAWVITRQNADWVELGVTAKDLSEQVKQLRSSLTFNIDKPFDTQLAYKIYRSTFGRFAVRLQGKTRLSVITNGAFTSLPLQLLVTKDPNGKPLRDIDWLVRSYTITNLPSVASLKTLRSGSRSSAPKPIIAFADPVFSKDQNTQVAANRNSKGRLIQMAALRSLLNFYEGGQPDLASLAKALSQLPDTADEVRSIADVLNADKSDLKLGILASETTVKQANLDDYRIVYFATHGLVSGEVEQFAKVKAEPALALTIPEEPTDLDDGLLTASEVAQLKMNADWVVLSACNTAAEEKPGAEALSGLARAFFYAGARSVVVSHWEVDSEATVRLMTGMFQASARNPKFSHAEALQQSMLSMIDRARSDDDAHPRIWAPFVVVGEPAKAK